MRKHHSVNWLTTAVLGVAACAPANVESPADSDSDAGVEVLNEDVTVGESSLALTEPGTASWTEYFPEFLRQSTYQTENGEVSGPYSFETCGAADMSAALRSLLIDPTHLNPLFSNSGERHNCPGCAVQGNTWSFASDVTFSGDTTKVRTDFPVYQHGEPATQGEPVGFQNFVEKGWLDGLGQVLTARNININGTLRLRPGRTYVFFASNAITFAEGSRIVSEAVRESTPAGNFKVVGPTAIKTYTFEERNGPILSDRWWTWAETRTTTTGTKMKDGEDGIDGARLVLIAPTVRGTGTIDLSGTHGGQGGSLPDINCQGGTISTLTGVKEYEDDECYKNAGSTAVAGKAGEGGKGGSLLVVSSTGTLPSTIDTDFSGGLGGYAGRRGTKRSVQQKPGYRTPTYSSSWSLPDYPAEYVLASKAYGTAGAAGKAGAAGGMRTFAMGSAKREFAYLLGGRVAKRWMINGRYFARDVDPDASAGPANRAKAMQYFRAVLDNFCETEPSMERAHSLVPQAVRADRVAMCTEAAARLAALAQGLNMFGVPHDLAVYIAPNKLEEYRDKVLGHIQSTFQASFDAAAKAAGAPKDAALPLEVLRNQAALLKTERDKEVELADLEREMQKQTAVYAFLRVSRNQAQLRKNTETLVDLQPELEAAMEPREKTLLRAFTDALSIAKELVTAFYTGGTSLLGSFDTFEKMMTSPELAEVKPSFETFKEFGDQLGEVGSAAGTIIEDVQALRDNWDVAEPIKGPKNLAQAGPALCAQAGSNTEQLLKIGKVHAQMESNVDVKDRFRAQSITDEMRRLIIENERLSKESCELWEEHEIARRRAYIADQSYSLALLRQKDAQAQVDFIEKSLATIYDTAAAAAAKREATCRQVRGYEELAFYLDFLAARAHWFTNLVEPNTRSARGNFRRHLLNRSNRAALDGEVFASTGLFSGFGNPGLYSGTYSTSEDTSSECTANYLTEDLPPAYCAEQQRVVGSIRDTGVVDLRLEDAPPGFDIHRARGDDLRVSRISATLHGAELYQKPTLVRYAHGDEAHFTKAGVRRSFLFPAESTELACRGLEGALSALTASAVNLNCASVPPRFYSMTPMAIPSGYIGTQLPPSADWTADWNMLGTSPYGEWRIDFRPMFREVGSAAGDNCYSHIAGLATGGVSSDDPARNALVKDCLGLSPEATDAELSKAVQKFWGVCDAYVAQDITGASYLRGPDTRCCDVYDRKRETQQNPLACADLGLTSDEACSYVPAECDAVCGPKCDQLKSRITGLTIDIEAVVSNN